MINNHAANPKLVVVEGPDVQRVRRLPVVQEGKFFSQMFSHNPPVEAYLFDTPEQAQAFYLKVKEA